MFGPFFSSLEPAAGFFWCAWQGEGDGQWSIHVSTLYANIEAIEAYRSPDIRRHSGRDSYSL